VEIRTNGTATVDWRALRRFGISDGRIPPDCVVRYRPNSLWIDHKAFILTGAAVILAQGITIAALLVQRAKRRRAEAEIQTQRTELAHVSRVSTMGQMASALAHELNQPLGAILRNAEAAELFLQKKEPDLKEIAAILEDIRKDDQRAGGVIDRMRSFLKRQTLEHSPVDLRALLEETVELARPDAKTRSVRLSLEAPARLPNVRGDRIHLQQVLLNLLLNGMDAINGTPDTERLVSVRATETSDGYLEVAVTDSGSGIPIEIIAKLFDPFFTTKSTGMGMGLAISRSIIEAHGGKIRATNNAGRGATFTFSLPVRRDVAG
jgi:C4-dicarboxylate-specific signal transduction histidine kinase